MKVTPEPKLTITLTWIQWVAAIAAAPFVFVTALRLFFAAMEWWVRVIGIGDVGATITAALSTTVAAGTAFGALVIVTGENIVSFRVKK